MHVLEQRKDLAILPKSFTQIIFHSKLLGDREDQFLYDAEVIPNIIMPTLENIIFSVLPKS